MLLLELAQLSEHPVVLFVAHDRIVFDVVPVVVNLDFFAQFGDSGRHLINVLIHRSNIAENLSPREGSETVIQTL